MKILLIGANGQLGTDLRQCLPAEDLIALGHAQMDITDPAAIAGQLDAHRPSVVINTAAFHRVDQCEDDPLSPFLVNAVGVRHLALACGARRIILVHFSTDYVFNGRERRPYTEEDSPEPLSVYGVSKLAGEYFVRTLLQRYFLIRTCGLYGVAGSSGKGGNFVETMLKLASTGKAIRVVADQVLTPTSTRDLAQVVKALMATEEYGLYHVTNQGSCSWYEFTQEIFHLTGLTPALSPISSEAYGAKARRPAYSVLAHGHLARIGLASLLRDWREALAEYLEMRNSKK